MNNTSPETLSCITSCTYVCPYIYLLKFLMNNLFSCCFEIMITPGGLRATCGQSHPWCGQLAPSAAGCVIIHPMDWWSRSGTVHRKYTGLPRRIDRNEYYFATVACYRYATPFLFNVATVVLFLYRGGERRWPQNKTGVVHRYQATVYFALLYIARQVTIPYSALQFRRNSPVFWCFEIPRMPGHKVACRAYVRIPMYSGL